MAKASKIKALTYLLGCLGFVIFAILTRSLSSVIALPLISCLTVFIFLNSNLQFSNILYRFNSVRKEILLAWWKKYIFPTQWRMSISWICGYISFSLVNLFIFKSLGSEAIAMYGFSTSLFVGISQLSSSPLLAILPNLSSLYASSQLDERYILFKKSLLQAIAIYSGSSIILILALFTLSSNTSILDGRILSFWNLSILAFSYLLYLVFSCLGLYLRTTGSEPLLRVSLLTAAATSALCYIGSNISLNTTVYCFSISMFLPFILTLNIHRQMQQQQGSATL